MYRDAEQHTDHSRQKKADPRPEQTAGFLTDGQKRSGAGEMVQREKNHADCRHPCPAIGSEDGTCLCNALRLYQRAALTIDHQKDGDDDFIRRNPKQKCHKNYARKSHECAKRLQEGCHAVQERMPIHHDILAKPDDCAGRDGNRHRSGEYKNRSVQHTADNHIPKLRAAIRRQLQNKGGRHTAQYGFAQQKGNSKRDADGKHNQKEHEAACGNRISPCKEKARKQNQRRETPITGNEAVREDGDQAFSGGFNDAAGCDPCGIAAKAHAQ